MSYRIDIQMNPEMERLMEMFSQGITEPAQRTIVGISSLIRNGAKRNLKEKVYSRKVPWKRTGALRQSVTSVTGKLTSTVQVGKEYGRFIEEGTQEHIIEAKSGKTLSWESGGVRHFAKYVIHPGTKPYPFFEPAVLKGQQEAGRIARTEMMKYLYKKSSN